MEEMNSLPSSISHRKLNNYLINAKKNLRASVDPLLEKDTQTDSLNELIRSWSSLSKELLFALNQKKSALTEGRGAKSLMALGAMEAHLNMCLQALKASETEE